MGGGSRVFEVATPSHLPLGFFAYSSAPRSIPETIRAAIQAINRMQSAVIRSWEDLRVNGKFIISEICDAIDECDFFCADVTGVNPNVMFELGYAIAIGRRIWLIRDDSYADTRKEFEQLRLLTTIGFSKYLNSEQIIKSFFCEGPHVSSEPTIFQQSIEPILSPDSGVPNILYLKS